MIIRRLGFIFPLLIVVFACSTEKNTFVNRVYHQTTAKYNGLYNANELLYSALKNYRENKKEDLFDIVSISQVPDKEEVMALYPALDTAIVKCTKVISLHAMPSAENLSKKKEEYNKWIDDNFITIGRAMYYRRDFDKSIKNFEFVRKFFHDDPSNYVATLWIARNQIQLGELGKAKLNLDKLDLALANTDNQKDQTTSSSDKGYKRLSSTAKKRLKNREKSIKAREEKNGLTFVPFPEKLKFDLYITKGEYFVYKNDYKGAINSLEKAIEVSKKPQRGRIYFILGQLYERTANPLKASENYANALKYITTYEIAFAAKLSKAVNQGGEIAKTDLMKMAKDAKNFENRDQIYYALGEVDMNGGQKKLAMQDFNRSIYYNVKNVRQKARTYNRIADINYSDKNYVSAQRYYDSCANLIDEKYPNYELIKNRADKLRKLVESIDIATYQDSVQRIAKMSPEERTTFAENLIKKMKEEEERKKQLALERQKELTTTGAITATGSGSKNYFTNQKQKSKGFDDFRRQWGYRDNEDNWRRSDKMSLPMMNDTSSAASSDTSALASEPKETGPTPEQLLADIPLTDSALAISNEKLVSARYDAGVIYKEQLKENKLAAEQFQKILDKNIETKYNPMSAFQLYKMFENNDDAISTTQKNYILTKYPESDYAEYLRDPDFFIKRKKIEEVYENEYLRYLDRYNRGLYYAVISKSDEVISEEPNNQFRAKYMLLKALSMGQMENDKSNLVPILEQLKLEYPSTPESAKADDMLNIIKNGYSKNIPVKEKEQIFKFSEDAEYWVVVVPDSSKENQLFTFKTKIADFNDRYFSKDHLKTETRLIGAKNVLMVNNLNLEDAKMYLNKFMISSNILGTLSQTQIFFISKENLLILFQHPIIKNYLDFFIEKY